MEISQHPNSMTDTDRITHLKFILGRYDQYANAVNTKGSFLLAFNSFAAGGFVVNFLKLAEGLKSNCTVYAWFQVISLLFVLVSVISIYLTIRAVYPALTSGNNRGNYQSLIFFGSVSELQPDTFLQQVKEADNASTINDLARQTNQVASILSGKFRHISWASQLVYVQLTIFFALFLFVVFN
ncbi:Pycsar system effector family protein [Hymenobacter seoulensis]